MIKHENNLERPRSRFEKNGKTAQHLLKRYKDYLRRKRYGI